MRDELGGGDLPAISAADDLDEEELLAGRGRGGGSSRSAVSSATGAAPARRLRGASDSDEPGQEAWGAGRARCPGPGA